MLTKAEALKKFAAFKDSELRACTAETRRAALFAKFSAAQLIQFWNETKHLSWPEYYGQTPWESAAWHGSGLATGNAR